MSLEHRRDPAIGAISTDALGRHDNC